MGSVVVAIWFKAFKSRKKAAFNKPWYNYYSLRKLKKKVSKVTKYKYRVK